MATHTRGRGTKFYRGVSAVYTQIARVVGLTPPAKTRTMLNISDLDDAVDSFGPGNQVPGKASVTLRFSGEEATQETLHDDLAEDDDAGTIDYKIEYADGTTQIFDGHMDDWSPQGVTREGDVQIQVGFQVTGEIPWPA